MPPTVTVVELFASLLYQAVHCEPTGHGNDFKPIPLSPDKMCQQPEILPPSVTFLLLTLHLDFTRSPLADKGTWCLLPTTPAMLPTATKRFDRTNLLVYMNIANLCLCQIDQVTDKKDYHNAQINC